MGLQSLTITVFFVLVPFFKSFGQESRPPINIAVSAPFLELSPLKATTSQIQNLHRLTHLSLVDFNREMEIVCSFCEKFEEKRQEKTGKYEIHFTLKNFYKFEDGDLVTAEHIKKSWEYYVDKTEKSPFLSAFSKIDSIEIISPLHVVFHYASYDIEHLTNLVLLKIVKKKGEEFLGIGPYSLDKIGPYHVSLTPKNSDLGNVLHFKTVVDQTTLLLKLQKGEIDLSVVDLPPRKIEWLRKNVSNLSFVEIPSTSYVYLGINHRHVWTKEFWMREVLMAYLPIEEILQHKFKGYGLRAHNVFSPVFKKWHRPNPYQVMEYNPELASSMLQKKGFIKKKGFWHTPEGEKLSLSLKVSDKKWTRELAESLAYFWRFQGIDIDLQSLEWGAYFSHIKKGQFCLTLGNWVGISGLEIIPFFFDSQKIPPKGGNRGRFSSQEVDLLLQEKKLQEAEEKAFQELAVGSLWYPKIIWAMNNSLSPVLLYPNESYLALVGLKKILNQK